MRSTRALIHLDNLKSNILQIKDFISSSVKLCIAVKADAYGHGAVECAKAAVDCGADFLAIATVDEGRQLREAGITLPLLLLSLCSKEEIKDAVSLDITPLVFDYDYAKLFSDECVKVSKTSFNVHIAVDTGMGRIGCLWNEAAGLAEKISSLKGIVIGGMCTHFAVSDSLKKEDEAYTENQFKKFKAAIEDVKAKGINPGICHCCNSAATLNNKEMHMDMVRPGIIVYGYYADEVSKEYLYSKGIKIDLKPVMTFETEISAIRDFEKGMSVGYGCTWKAEKNVKIAVLPVGYDDGFLRRFSDAKIKVAVNGHECPVRGRICMDQCMIELDEKCRAKRWDKVIIFGDKRFGAMHTADDIAKLTSTISYEITCGVSKRVPRVFLTSQTR